MKKIWCLPLLFLFLTAGCSLEVTTSTSSSVSNAVQEEIIENYVPYNGADLKIGTVEIVPEVNEKNITFTTLTLGDLEKNEAVLNELDAIFIMKDHLVEASASKYTAIYHNLKIPVFFIDTTKSFIPFTEKELNYEEVEDFEDQNYIAGIYPEGAEFRTWQYGLYNNVENKETIKMTYTNVFLTIDELIHERSKN
ncbi:hypothetical protein [Carnobacterium mobile]|uniref:hypothetical protein n=1 Tax=Carnobacterium mobile TaxID=2750 RepID=UPI00186846D3|nr:hypothetical protein [Carnobacterium mobile]